VASESGYPQLVWAPISSFIAEWGEEPLPGANLRDEANTDFGALRASVPGGWLVLIPGHGLAFVPDPMHSWDGNSVA
jgi:hypothetical protein